MVFNSLSFLLFFPSVCLIYFVLPGKIRWCWLLAASFIYYALWNVKYTGVLVGAALFSWLCGLLIASSKSRTRKKVFTAIGILGNLSLLFIFKYFRFGLSILNRGLGIVHLPAVTSDFNVLQPLGISFFILQTISYLMDVFRGKAEAEKDPFRLALYVSFFPQILSGPIERYWQRAPELTRPHSFEFDRVKRGLWLMLWGYFQKLVLADRLAIFVNTVFADATLYQDGGIVNLLTMFFYSLQVYQDFAGYSNIAIGAAEVLGFRATTNFVRPFFSANFTELWQRWHISLSKWLIEYVYIPLGGNRAGKLRTKLNLMIVFLTSGLWHGTDATYLVWGFLNGAISLIERALAKPFAALRIDTGKSGWKVIQTVYCMVCFMFTVTFFRAETVRQALDMLRGMFVFNPQILFTGQLLEYGLDRVNFAITFIAIAVLFLVSLFQRSGSVRTKIEQQPLIIRWALIIGAVFTILLFGIYGPGFDAGQFVYLQF